MTEAKELPSGWSKKRLDEIGQVYSGSTPSTNVPDYWDGGIVWITPNDLSKLNTPYISSSGRTISAKGLNSSSTHLLPSNSIVVSSRAPIGYIAIPQVVFCTNQGCKSFDLHPGYNAEFVYYNLNFHIEKLKSVGEGTTFSEISKTALCAIQIPFPNLKDEQQKIAAVLSRIDRVIELTEALIAKQQRLKVGLMHDLLTRGIDEHGKLRSEATHEFKDSPLGRIPTEWYVTSIGNQFTVRRDRGRTGLPIMSIVMNDGLVERSSIVRRVETALTPEQHALVCEGDIAYNMMRMWQGVLGRASCDCLVSPAYVVLKPLGSINPRFAEWLFRDVRMVHAFRQASKGVVDDRLRLYPKDIFPIPMAIPQCVEEQSQIADRLDAQLQAIASEIRALEKLRHVRGGLMQDLLTGKVLVTSLLETELRTT
jgi:type I restriction enzyme S subunit